MYTADTGNFNHPARFYSLGWFASYDEALKAVRESKYRLILKIHFVRDGHLYCK